MAFKILCYEQDEFINYAYFNMTFLKYSTYVLVHCNNSYLNQNKVGHDHQPSKTLFAQVSFLTCYNNKIGIQLPSSDVVTDSGN